jgi:hypothetical protein
MRSPASSVRFAGHLPREKDDVSACCASDNGTGTRPAWVTTLQRLVRGPLYSPHHPIGCPMIEVKEIVRLVA